jgi:uncharacterized protein YjiK
MKKIALIVIIAILISAVLYCNIGNGNDINFITPIKEIQLSVPEPSDLYFDKSTNTLWTVGDETSKIYNIDLKGKVLDTKDVNGFDLEGITFINDTTLAVILERDRIVVLLNKNGNETKRFSIDLYGKPNKGLEGISFNGSTNHLYIVNEKSPKVLLETDLEGNILKKVKINFAEDLSGVHYSTKNNLLWLISDESKSVYKCSAEGELISSYKVDIEQIEGIAVDDENLLLYLVSDPLEKLYIFSLP